MEGARGSGADAATAPYGRAVAYREKLPRRWTVATVAVLTGWVAYQGSVLLPDDSTLWYVMLGLSAFFALVLNAVPISKRVYHRIRLRDGQLTVGRETIAVDSLTAESIREASEQPTDAEFAAALASRSPEELTRLRQASRATPPPRLVGGGWSVPLGMEQIVVETVRGEALLIATHDREALLDALTRARQV
ncbi:hypothetical protein [Streptomyces capillispiralis]|uniref:DUF3093 family protein n=1 Tax=Streptomyces capillispiralis TaxID=68182 RepID=A0A561TD95_9ACTN|nr:hypothetical protein [Streptomyces capillispiralis]TWF85077.1 hypothetical protein FHX78_112025 [Streptomyces capillispiralis]GHH95621.1 hypothetical protein GCM10017779_60780 [Streptomyces capillispiralis]